MPELKRLKARVAKSVVEEAGDLSVEKFEDHYVVYGPGPSQQAHVFLEKRGDEWWGLCNCPTFTKNLRSASAAGVTPCPHIIAVKRHLETSESPLLVGGEGSEETPVPSPQAGEQAEEPPKPVPQEAPAPPQEVSDFVRREKLLRDFIKQALVPQADYDQIPGTPKPVLLKPGAEKLALFFGFEKRFDIVKQVEDWEKPFFYYLYRCQLFWKGRLVAEAYGSANSREAKWGYRWVKKEAVPPDLNPEELPKRLNSKGEVEYRIPNPDIYSLVDTIQKMALKRAFVAAVRLATATSGIFAEEVAEE